MAIKKTPAAVRHLYAVDLEGLDVPRLEDLAVAEDWRSCRWVCVDGAREDLALRSIKRSPYVLENYLIAEKDWTPEMIRIHRNLWGFDERFSRALLREYCDRMSTYEGPVEGLTGMGVPGKVLMRIEVIVDGKMRTMTAFAECRNMGETFLKLYRGDREYHGLPIEEFGNFCKVVHIIKN